jgi:HisJ family histidinol phosphate phosphatase
VSDRDKLPDQRVEAIPDVHGHAKGEHKPFAEERPIPYTARMLFLWFYHACRRGSPRFLMVADHINYLTFEDPAAVNLVRRALKLAHAGDLYGAAETAGVELGHAAVVSQGLVRGMRYSIGAEVDNDPRSRPDAQNIVDAMRPDAMIRSVHFLTIEHPEHGAGWQWPFDNPDFKDLYDHVGTAKVWSLYMAILLEAIEKLPGNIVGHFYVPAKFGHWPDDATLESYEDQLVHACAARNMAIELNTRYLYHHYADDESSRRKYRNANLRLLKKAKARGIGIAVGSDAHSPKDQGGGFETALELLDKAGINEIVFPVDGRMARVALRATEELLKQKATPPPPPIGSSVSGFGRAELAARSGGAVPPHESEYGGARRRKAAQAAAASAAKSAKAALKLSAAAKKAQAKKAAPPKKAPPAKKAIPTKKAAPAPKPLAKKLVAKKLVAKKTAAKPTVPAKRVAAKKKAAAKKPAPKKAAIKKNGAARSAKRVVAKRSASKKSARPASKKKSKSRR